MIPEKVVRLESRPRFGRVSPAAARVKIRAESHRVYIALSCFANRDGWCWPSVSTIAAASDIKRRHVHRALQQLVAVELVRIERHAAGKKNRYQLIGITGITTEGDAPIVTEGDAPIATEGDAPMTTEGDAPITTGGTRAKKNKPLNRSVNRVRYFSPQSEDCEIAVSQGYTADWIADQVERFRDHNLSNGREFVDINAAWRNWLRRAMDLDDDPPNAALVASPVEASDKGSKTRGATEMSDQDWRKILVDYRDRGGMERHWPREHGLPPQRNNTSRVPQHIHEEFGY